jgi:large repetitive protein
MIREARTSTWAAFSLLACLAVLALAPAAPAETPALPQAPAITGPPSPAQSRTPSIIGAAPAETTVSIFVTGDCSGSPLAAGPAAVFTTTGLPTAVAANTKTWLYASATDGRGPVPPCSAGFLYANDSAPPRTTITGGPAPSTARHRAVFRFKSNEATARFECKLDSEQWQDCKSKRIVHVPTGRHTFKVRTRDEASNVDPTPARYSWRVR